MKRLSVLGSTGSVGTATLDVVGSQPDRFRVVALAAGRDSTLLRHQIETYRPQLIAVASAAAAADLRRDLPAVQVVWGADGLEAAARADSVDLVMNALVGVTGLAPTFAAIRAGKDLALANKESLVVAGELIVSEAAARGVSLLPVDSEHSGLQQILDDRSPAEVSRLILTASGGPFRSWDASRIAAATVDEALAHPTWRMGRKISIDSATMANKGLEIIEAHHLFGVGGDRIDVVIHPQSLVHSAVVFRDNSLLAQLAVTDMRLPILRALGGGEDTSSPVAALDLAAVGRLDFETPDEDRFPALALARAAMVGGAELPAVFNAANEIAVEAFLSERCSFDRIAGTIAAVMDRWAPCSGSITSVEQALAVDAEARRLAERVMGNTAVAPEVPRS